MSIVDQKTAAGESLAHELQIELKNSLSGYLSPGLMQALGEIDPPLNNMGGGYPSTPIFLPQYEKQVEKLARYETRVDASKSQTAKLDWVGFSFPIPGDELSGVAAVEYGLKAIWPDLEILSGLAKMRGYGKTKALMVQGVQIGSIGYGATHKRDTVNLTGDACSALTHEGISLLYEFLMVIEARLTRVDICLDLYNGERTWDHALWRYQCGAFKHPKAPQSPEHKIVESKDGSGRNKGRTLYVGKRSCAVMARIYEKGLEVFANMPEAYREASTQREEAFYADQGLEVPTGTIADNWLRVEVEYKRRDDKDLPFDMLIFRDGYFAGSYEYCADLLGGIIGERPKTMKSLTEVSLDKQIREMRRSYGNTVYSLTQAGFTPEEIVQFVSTGVHSQKLVKSGLLRLIQNDEQWKAAVRERAALKGDADIPF